MRISDWSSDVCSSDLDLHRHLAVRRIRTRLEYQNPVGAARRQSIGENASGRAAADDDEVVFHPGFPYRSVARSVTRTPRRRPAEADAEDAPHTGRAPGRERVTPYG